MRRFAKISQSRRRPLLGRFRPGEGPSRDLLLDNEPSDGPFSSSTAGQSSSAPPAPTSASRTEWSVTTSTCGQPATAASSTGWRAASGSRAAHTSSCLSTSSSTPRPTRRCPTCVSSTSATTPPPQRRLGINSGHSLSLCILPLSNILSVLSI